MTPYTKFCTCGKILTIEEMDKEINPSGLCEKCTVLQEYNIYIKSHCSAPDFEGTILARSKKDAAIKFRKKYQLDMSADELMDFIDG